VEGELTYGDNQTRAREPRKNLPLLPTSFPANPGKLARYAKGLLCWISKNRIRRWNR
jgi:hypothetical protein